MAQLSVPQRRTISIALLVGVVVAGLAFYAALHHQRPKRIRIERDASDISPLLSASPVESFYDPVFVQRNHSADFVFSITNTMTLDR